MARTAVQLSKKSTSAASGARAPEAVPSVQRKALRGMDFAAQEAALAPVQMKAVQREDDGESWWDRAASAASGAVDSVAGYLGGGGGKAQSAAAPAQAGTEQAGGEQSGGESLWDRAKGAVEGAVDGVEQLFGGGEKEAPESAGSGEAGGEESWLEKAERAVAGVGIDPTALVEGAENAVKGSWFDRVIAWFKGEDAPEDETLLETWIDRLSSAAEKAGGKAKDLGKLGKNITGFAGGFRKLGTASGKNGKTGDGLEIASQVVHCGDNITGAAGNIADVVDKLSAPGDLRALGVSEAIGKAKERLGQLDTIISALDMANQCSRAAPDFNSRAGCIAWAHQVGNAFKAAGGLAKGLSGDVPGIGAVFQYFDLPSTIIESMIPVITGYWDKVDRQGLVGYHTPSELVPEGSSSSPENLPKE